MPPPPHPYDAARALIAADFRSFENDLDEVLRGQADYLQPVEMDFFRQGKKLRPLLLLLSAHCAARTPVDRLPEKVIAAAVAIELVHVGSLIHDDIVDRAPLRRGLPTISAARGYELALIIGDLQWIAATRRMAAFMEDGEDIVLMRRFLETGEQVCRGQLDEMLAEAENDHAARIRRYFRTVDRKTGKLLAFACQGGALLVNGSAAATGCLNRFGTMLGRAFQVMDDILDIVRPTASAGKESLTDVLMGRLSLPILYTLETLPADHFMQGLLRNEPLPPERLAEAMEVLQHSDGWIRAYSDARAIVIKAQANLELLPSGPHRRAMEALAAHLVDQGFLDTYGVQDG